MEKQFKFAVAIEFYNQETIEFCKEVGCNVKFYTDNHKYLTNNYNGCIGDVKPIKDYSKNDYNRILVNWNAEKDLCKALLAATLDEDNLYKHELYYYAGNTLEIADCDVIGLSQPAKNRLRKPTLEQLLAHFRKDKAEERKHIGYICPQDYYGGRVKKGDIIAISKKWDDETTYQIYFKETENYEFFPAELVETWQKAYEDDENTKQLKSILHKYKVDEISKSETIEQIKNLFK
jgi:hypothetical protein